MRECRVKRNKLDLMGIRFIETNDSGEGGEVEMEVEAAPDTEIFTSKIADLEGQLSASVAKIAELEGALTAAKAVNYDLLMSVDSSSDVDETNVTDDDSDEEEVDVDDLFGEDE